MLSNYFADNYSSIEGKTIIFYDARYDRAFKWHATNKEETMEAIRAWTALGVPAVGLFDGWTVDIHEPILVPFDGYTVDNLKQYLADCNGWVIPPGMKHEPDFTVFTRTGTEPDEKRGM
jgi:hypothetical protein